MTQPFTPPTPKVNKQQLIRTIAILGDDPAAGYDVLEQLIKSHCLAYAQELLPQVRQYLLTGSNK